MNLNIGDGIEPNSENVNLANNKPLAYVLCVVVILLGIVTTMYFKSNNTNHDDCQSENTRLTTENRLLFNTLISQKVSYDSLKKNTDNVIRAKININIKKHKQHEN